MEITLELQEKNCVDIENCSHSRYTATRMAKQIAIKTSVFKSIIEQNVTICITIVL